MPDRFKSWFVKGGLLGTSAALPPPPPYAMEAASSWPNPAGPVPPAARFLTHRGCPRGALTDIGGRRRARAVSPAGYRSPQAMSEASWPGDRVDALGRGPLRRYGREKRHADELEV